MGELNAVDMSSWGKELTEEEAKCMIAQGIELIIVGTGYEGPQGGGEYSYQQASTWLKAGGKYLDAYKYLLFTQPAQNQLSVALGCLHELADKVRIWWLDAEDTTSEQLTPKQRQAFLQECVQIMAGKDVGIYSGAWWWKTRMQGIDSFAAFPLWNSYYDKDPDTDGLPYGGWTESAIEQYDGTQYVCGQSVDINYAKNLVKEWEMTEEDKAIWEKIKAIFTNGGSEPLDAAVADGSNYIAGYNKLFNDFYAHKHEFFGGKSILPVVANG